MATFPIGKLNPQTSTTGGVTTAVAKLNFPGFQEILDFTATGSESSVSVTVDGDTDKEYWIACDNLDADGVVVRLNNDSSANIYGRQYIDNTNGTITAGRQTFNYITLCVGSSFGSMRLLTPTGFIKTSFNEINYWSTGTTIVTEQLSGWAYNSTSNITSINILMYSGNFTSGTRIVVYARRSNV